MASNHQNYTTNNFKMAATCPVCLGYFKQPKQLPNCPHTLCLECLPRSVGNQSELYGSSDGTAAMNYPDQRLQNVWFECPVCRTLNYIGPGGVEALSTNYVAQQIAEIVEAQQMKPANDENRQTCTHTFETIQTNRYFCPHCNFMICKNCKVVHKEFMKVEVAAMMDAWVRDYPTARKLENLSEDVRSSSAQQLELLGNKLQATIQTLNEAISACLHSKSREIYEQARMAQNSRLSTTRQAFDIVSGKNATEAMRIKNLLQQSVLNVSLGEMVALHNAVSEANKKLVEADSLPQKLQLDFEADPATLLLNVVNEVRLGDVIYG